MPLSPVHGKNATILVQPTDASPWLNDAAEDWTFDLADTTVFGVGAQSSIPGYPGGTNTLTGPLDATQTSGGEAIVAALIAGSVSVPITVVPQGAGVQGNSCSVANMFASHHEPQSVYTDVAKFTSSWVYATKMDPDGMICQSNVAVAGASFNQTGNTQYKGTSTDFLAVSTFGGIANLHVITNTLNQTLTVKLVHDTAVGLGTAVDVTSGGFTTIGTGLTGSQSIIVPAQSLNRYIGVVATAGAASPTGSVTFVLSFGRFSY